MPGDGAGTVVGGSGGSLLFPSEGMDSDARGMDLTLPFFECRENLLSLGRVKKRGREQDDGGEGGTSIGFEFLDSSGVASSENGDCARGVLEGPG